MNSVSFQSLEQIVAGRQPLSADALNQISCSPAARELQSRLVMLGLLDPLIAGSAAVPFGPNGKVDGAIGPNTIGALSTFADLIDAEFDTGRKLLHPELLASLIETRPEELLPVGWADQPSDTTDVRLARRVLRYMRRRGYHIARGNEMYNIVYLEGADADGRPNADVPDEWNDRRLVIYIGLDGTPTLVHNAAATTEPGKFFTHRPMHAQGAARLAFGQYKAWIRGFHQGVQPALVQRGLLRVHRDRNKDFKRSPSDPIDVGNNFGLNQHSTGRGGAKPRMVGPYSAGCLVGQDEFEHAVFLQLLGQDERARCNTNYVYMTTLIPGDELARNEFA